MRKVLMTLWTALAVVMPLIGQQLPQTYRACMDKAANPLAMAACEDRELRRLQSVVTQRSQQLTEAIRQNKTFGNDEKALAKIQAEEQAWDRYVSAYLDALYPVPENDRVVAFGRRYLHEGVAARSHLMRIHISVLERLIHQYSD